MVTNIPSATLRQLVKLVERKEALMAQIQQIDRQMARLQGKAGGLPENIGLAAPIRISRSTRKSPSSRRTKRRR